MLLRSLPSEWNTHVVVWRNKLDLDSMSFDDIYNNFRSSTNEVNTANVQVNDLEEMDLKWQLALLSMRARRYYQRTGKKITINGSDTAGYDKSKKTQLLRNGGYCGVVLMELHGYEEVHLQLASYAFLRFRVNTAKINSVNTAKGNRVTSAVGEQGINAVKSSACWVWRPKIKADSSLELKVLVDTPTQQMVINSPCLIDKKELAIPGQTTTGKE
ncbi:hypothetical protein Tco_0174634 [Tanacetum coccineum]